MNPTNPNGNPNGRRFQLPKLSLDIEEEPSSPQKSPEECTNEINSVKIPTFLEEAPDLVKIAYRYLKLESDRGTDYDPNLCWASSASMDQGNVKFTTKPFEVDEDSPIMKGSSKFVRPYPEKNSMSVIVRCRALQEGVKHCLRYFHQESSKQILLRFLLEKYLKTLGDDENQKRLFARIPEVTNIGYENNDPGLPFRMDQRVTQTAAEYIREIKDQSERQQAFCAILLQVMNTLRVLWEISGFVHGDLKLDNIGVETGQDCIRTYIMDYGLSCIRLNIDDRQALQIGSLVSPYRSNMNPSPVMLLPNDLLFLLVSSVTKMQGIFALGCADHKRCALEKMILFILTTIGKDDMYLPYVVYEPDVFVDDRARILSRENVEAIACSLILNFKNQCTTSSESTIRRLNKCEIILSNIANEINRAVSPFENAASDNLSSSAFPVEPSSPPVVFKVGPGSWNSLNNTL